MTALAIIINIVILGVLALSWLIVQDFNGGNDGDDDAWGD
jgi:hypothetical protein